jgi:hypothetical protein
MNKSLVLIVGGILLLAVIAIAVLAVCYHRVAVVEGISGSPIAGAYILVQYSSGSQEEVGRTASNGKLAFWVNPLPLAKIICAQSTFYPPACTKAICLVEQRIELAVPAGVP